MRWILLIVMAGIVAGCSLPLSMLYNKESPRTSLRDDGLAKKFIPDENHGTIYIFRDRLAANDDAIQVLINELVIGNVGVYTYFAFKIPAGNYELRTHLEIITINVDGGDMIFINAKVGTITNLISGEEEIAYVLKRVSVERGKLGVLHSDRLKHQYHILPLVNLKPDDPRRLKAR